MQSNIAYCIAYHITYCIACASSRVLGRAGLVLAWGVHFQKVPYLIVVNLKSQRTIWFMTAFLQCFWISTQIGFASFGNLVSSFAKVLEPFCIVFLWASFSYFQNFRNLESGFQIFLILDQQNWCWGQWTFLDVFTCPKIHELVYIIDNFL